MSQRCSYLYLLAQRDFVRALAAISEALFTPGGTGLGTNALQPQPAAARRKLEALLHVLRVRTRTPTLTLTPTPTPTNPIPTPNPILKSNP